MLDQVTDRERLIVQMAIATFGRNLWRAIAKTAPAYRSRREATREMVSYASLMSECEEAFNALHESR